jgi:AraC-like DNA-binding protein/ribosomal protein S18 acetylase RimI-like enzyme
MFDVLTTQRTIDYIEEHVSEKLDLQQISEEVHLSPFHLHRIFAHTLGQTIHEYLRKRQLTQAAKLLSSTKKPILEIALEAGYESQQAFSRIFKAMYKCPPNVFRQHGRFYPLQLRFESPTGFFRFPGPPQCVPWKVLSAQQLDIPQLMELSRLVIDGYPLLHEEEHRQVLQTAIAQNHAFIIKAGNIAAGAMLFSPDVGHIDFLAVHPLFRTLGVSQALLNQAIFEFPVKQRHVSITTYREGDKADTGHRKALEALGFVESELLVEFGYPTQRFLLNRDLRLKKNRVS